MLESNKEYEKQKFVGLDASSKEIISSSFSGYTFKNCNLFQANLSGSAFLDCTFNNCNVSMVGLRGVHFNNVEFTNCKLMGNNFEFCKFDFGFSANFINCVLEMTNFSAAKIQGCSFKGSIFKKASFIGAKMTRCDFSGCDFEGATFDGANLSESNFKHAMNYAIDPVKNKISRAVFSMPEVVGLLGNLDIKIED